jgi:DnaK suppressor protein
VVKPVFKKPSGASASGRNGAKKSGVASHALNPKARHTASTPPKSTGPMKSGKPTAKKEPEKTTKAVRLATPAPERAAAPKRPAAPPAPPPPQPAIDRAPREPVAPRAAKPGKPAPEPPAPVAIAEAVPTDGKPRKNLAGFGMRDLEHFRDLLFAKRREIVGDMSSMEREALRSSGGSNLSTLPIHMADMGTDNYEQEFTLGLVEKDRNLLREINAALGKIQNGTFGICEGTGKPIGRPRLEAQPWARFSIEHARSLERPGRT